MLDDRKKLRRDAIREYNYTPRETSTLTNQELGLLANNDIEDLTPEYQPGVVESGKMGAEALSAERDNQGMSAASKAKLAQGIGSALGNMFGGDPAGASRFKGLQTIRATQPEDSLAARRVALRNLLGR